MDRHPTLGRIITRVGFGHMTTTFLGHLEIARIFEQIKADRTIEGYILFHRNEIGANPAFAVMPYGPNCTFKTVDDASGVAIGGGVPLTDPRYASMYAKLPALLDDAEIDWKIKHHTMMGMDQLNRVWVGRKHGTGLRYDDLIVNETTNAKMVVLTFGGRTIDESRVLVCPQEFFSREMETDTENPNCGYTKHHDKWEWMELSVLLERGFNLLCAKDGMPFARLVAKKKDDNV
jgi:hypothetical protein